jgi:hypothetical protein
MDLLLKYFLYTENKYSILFHNYLLIVSNNYFLGIFVAFCFN